MDNCYLGSPYLPKGEGNRMESPQSGSFGIFLAYSFLPGIFDYYLSTKTHTLQTVCDNCFAANQGNTGFILVIGAIILIGLITLSVWDISRFLMGGNKHLYLYQLYDLQFLKSSNMTIPKISSGTKLVSGFIKVVNFLPFCSHGSPKV